MTVVSTLAASFWNGSSSFLQVTRTALTQGWVVNSGSAELAALERLENCPLNYNGRNVVITLALSFLNGSSSNLQVRRTTIID